MNQVRLQSVKEKYKDFLSQLIYDYRKELLPYSQETLADIKTYTYLPSYFTDSDRAAFFILVNDVIGGLTSQNQ